MNLRKIEQTQDLNQWNHKISGGGRDNYYNKNNNDNYHNNYNNENNNNDNYNHQNESNNQYSQKRQQNYSPFASSTAPPPNNRSQDFSFPQQQLQKQGMNNYQQK